MDLVIVAECLIVVEVVAEVVAAVAVVERVVKIGAIKAIQYKIRLETFRDAMKSDYIFINSKINFTNFNFEMSMLLNIFKLIGEMILKMIDFHQNTMREDDRLKTMDGHR